MLISKYLFLILIISYSTSIQGQEYINKNPKKAAIYSSIIPGAGQIYTKKYWKIPIIYAGLATSAYYINHNHESYKTYKQAYLNRLDGVLFDEYTDVYTDSELVTLTEYYRRNTEISALLFTLTYILNIIDASVNAHLFNYNVSEDISMEIKPVYFSRDNISGLSLAIKL